MIFNDGIGDYTVIGLLGKYVVMNGSPRTKSVDEDRVASRQICVSVYSRPFYLRQG
jgi:hypothetical protein